MSFFLSVLGFAEIVENDLLIRVLGFGSFELVFNGLTKFVGSLFLGKRWV